MSRQSPIALRAARREDLVAITAIYARYVRSGTASFEVEPPDEAEITRRWVDIVQRGLPYLVAERGNEVVGYAYAAPYRARPAYRYTVEDSIYVRDDCAGAGIGRALLDALIAACERWGARQMVAVIGDSANAASIRVHAAAGFARTGTLPDVGWKFGRWLDVVLMQRALGPGATSPASDAGASA
jgi:phosphinothricin acetyltransferase